MHALVVYLCGALLTGEDSRAKETDGSIAVNRKTDAPEVELLASIAHDLRQPLTTVRASAELLRHRAQRAESAPETWLDHGLAQIEEAGLRMEQLIDELVDLARIRAGNPLQLSRRPTDLAALAAQVAAAQATGERQRVRLEIAQPSVIG